MLLLRRSLTSESHFKVSTECKKGIQKQRRLQVHNSETSALHLCQMKVTINTKALQALIRLDCRGLATDGAAELLGYEETTCDSESRDGEKTGAIVHGLLGSARNWRGFSRELAKSFANKTGRCFPQACSCHILGAQRRDQSTAVMQV